MWTWGQRGDAPRLGPRVYTAEIEEEVQIITDSLVLPRLLTGQRHSQGQRACPRLETVLRVPSAENIIGNACLKSLIFNIPKPQSIQPAMPHSLLCFSIVCFLWREFLFPFSIKLLLILQDLLQMASLNSLSNNSLAPLGTVKTALPCSVHITFVFWLKGEWETKKPEQTFLFSN